jgi:hypothetical protein
MSATTLSEKHATLLAENAEHKNELTRQEREWIAKLAKVMSSGYGADRGCNPTQVRSGVYRGALLTLLPLVAEFSDDLHDAGPLTMVGVQAMREALTKNKFLPLP